MKKILIPIDGSEFSDRALQMGKDLAQTIGGSVVLLHVVNVEIPSYVDFTSTSAIGSNLDSVRAAAAENAKIVLDKGKEFLGDLCCVATLETSGYSPADSIVRTADAEGVDLIIMGSEGTGSFSKGILMGSVTNRVLHLTKIPLLVVK